MGAETETGMGIEILATAIPEIAIPETGLDACLSQAGQGEI
jgi:hypothetical protein